MLYIFYTLQTKLKGGKKEEDENAYNYFSKYVYEIDHISSSNACVLVYIDNISNVHSTSLQGPLTKCRWVINWVILRYIQLVLLVCRSNSNETNNNNFEYARIRE